MTKLTGSELLEHVIEISRRMVETRELEVLLPYAISEVLELVGAERGYIVLLEADGSLSFRVKRRQDGSDIPEMSDDISHSILNEVVRTGQSLVIGNAMGDPRFAQAASVLYMRLRSVMCVPLKTQDRTIGAIYVENRSIHGRFRNNDLPPLELFANQAAVAIANAALNEEMERINKELQQLNETKSNLIVLVSHELRTPITFLYGYMQLLKQNPQPFLIDKLGDAVNRVVGTIDEIVDVFRLMSGQIELEKVEISLGTLVKEVVKELAQVCESRQLNIHISRLEELPDLWLDKQKIEIVLRNVIGNAIKYTPNGGKICIDGRLLTNGVELQVKDNGIGISAEKLPQIFTLFAPQESVEHHSTSKYAFRGGGLGLGLNVAKGLLELHGGSIRVESPGYNLDTPPGTTCFITLPVLNSL